MNSNQRVIRLLIFFELFFSIFRLHADGATAFHAEGVLKQYAGTNLQATFTFTISVERCQWLIRIVPKGTPIAYYEDGFDGKFTYYYIKFRNKPARAINAAAAIVETNNIPYVNSPYATAVWLAYGSFCYFGEVNGNEVKPFLDWGEPNPDLEDVTVKVDWERFEQAPFLPSYIYSKDMGRRYIVNDTTNYNGILLPLNFILEGFANRQTNTFPIFSLRGTLKAITNNVLVDFKPKINGATYTEDRRFIAASEPVKQLHYLDTNVNWLATSNVQLISLYHQQLLLQSLEPSTHKLSRPFILILLACPTIAFVIFMLFQWKQKNARDKNI